MSSTSWGHRKTPRQPMHHLPSLPDFWLLPRELQSRIISLACRSPQATYDRDPAYRCLVALDFQTTFSLTLSSRALYALATPILYANVKITRPSILTDFLATIEANSSLGNLVKSLQLGPDKQLPQHWWPMWYLRSSDRGFLGLRHLSTSLYDQDRLPRWCCPNRSWPLSNRDGGANWRDTAVLAAVTAAEWGVDVNLVRPRYSAKGVDIGSDEWFQRVMLVQAALDLYLLEMRRVEDAAGYPVEKWKGLWSMTYGPQPIGSAIPYPALLVVDSKSPDALECRRRDGQQRLVLGSRDLYEHIGRRGSLADYFDHPFFFARSRLRPLDFEDNGQAHMGADFTHSAKALYDDNDPDRNKHGSGTSRHEHTSFPTAQRGQQSHHRPPSPTVADTTTLEGLLRSAERLLTLTTRVRNLFLTSFLQRLICGADRKDLPLPSLRYLCLGPYSIYQADSLAPTWQSSDLLQLQQLRISGCWLAGRKSAVIAALPRLQLVDWDLTYAPEPRESAVFSTVKTLVEALEADSPASSESPRKKSKPSSEPSSENVYSHNARAGYESLFDGAPKTTRLVDVSLHWAVVDAAVSTLEKEEDRMAWSQGLSLCQDPHRLELRMNDDEVFDFGNKRYDGASAEAESVNHASRVWWEECAVGLPHHRPIPDFL